MGQDPIYESGKFAGVAAIVSQAGPASAVELSLRWSVWETVMVGGACS